MHVSRVSFALTAFFASSILFSQAGPGSTPGAEDQVERPEYGVPHPECTLFTDHREQILRGDLERRNANDALSLSALTEQVVNALPPAGGPPSPARGRTGSLQQTKFDNYIDTHIFTALQRLGIPPAALSTDQEFLRRVTLDLTGRIPGPMDVLQFLADPAPTKRADLINRLLDSPEWADRWAMFFGDLYRNTAATAQVVRYQQGRDPFHYFILDSLRANKSYKDMAWEILTASGNTFDNWPSNFTLGGRTTGGPAQDTYDTQAVNVSTAFLGISHLDCILCHDGAGHLDSLSLWGSRARRADAWGMAAFFSRTDLTAPNGNPLRTGVVTDVTTASRNYALNTTTGNRPARRAIGQTFVLPASMFGGGTPKSGENWREALARLVTSDFQFARAIVNYVWRELMVVALVDPPDQFDPLRLDVNNPPPAPWTLQPSNPQLLDALARNFIRNNYDLRALMRDITTSRAYQLSARYDGNWNPTWEKYYARRLVRRLRAEEIHDAVVLSSGVMPGYALANFREPYVNFAMQLPDVVGIPGGVGSQFLDSFLRGNRQDDDRRNDLTILQALNLMNNTFVYNRARNVPGTLLYNIMNQGNPQLIQGLYLAVLSRYPTQPEMDAATAALTAGPRANKAEDLFWSLYNKVDFIFNY